MSDERCEFAKAKNEEIRQETLREVRDALVSEENKKQGETHAQGNQAFINGWNMAMHTVAFEFGPGGRFEVPCP